MLRAIVYTEDMKRDGRTLDHRTLEEIRRMAVQRVREGEDPSTVIVSYGFCRTTIYKWLRAASRRGRGLRALAARKATGRPRTLTLAQERQVYRWINGKDPRQYGFAFALWTRKVVGELIEREFGVKLGVTAVGKLLAKLGLTPQKPLQRAYQRDPEAIARWQQESYPRLAKEAKARGAEIYFWDESGFRADGVQGRTWGVQGHTPVVAVPGQRQSMSAASAVNARGAFWFVTYQGVLNAALFVDYLKRLMKHRKKPLTLILDSLPAHKGPLVRGYIESLQGKLQLHYLPGYAPDLNPDELVWNHMKRTGTAKKPLRKGDQLQSRIDADLQAIQRNPKLVRSFFRAPSIAYISDC
jgi:transposase